MKTKVIIKFCMPFIVAGFLSGCQKECIELKEENFVFEYGENVIAMPKNYLKDDISDDILKHTEFLLYMPFENDEENNTTEEYIINEDNNIVSNGKEYLDVGDYTFYINYENTKYYIFKDSDTIEVNISVKDTTPPEIILSKDSISLYKGEKLDESSIKELITCKDLSVFETSIDLSGVDINNAGSYVVHITAIDTYNNESKAEVKVEVKEKPVIKTNNTASSNNTPSSTSVSTSTQNNQSYIFKADGNVSSDKLSLADSELNLVPSNIVNAAIANGWKFYVTSKDIASNYYNGDASQYWGKIVALTRWGEKEVFIYQNNIKTSGRSVLHEMGHVLDCMSGTATNSEEFDSIYNAEKGKYVGYTGDTNPDRIVNKKEYFASSFMQYILNNAGIRANAPQTYNFIKSLIEKY